MTTDDLPGAMFDAPVEVLAVKYRKPASQADADARPRRTRPRSGTPAVTQPDLSPAPRTVEPTRASNPVRHDAAEADAAPGQGSSSTLEQASDATDTNAELQQTTRRTSASIPADVWHAVAHYCVTNSVSRIGLIMRALAKTNGQHKDLVDRERSRDTTSSEDDKAAMEMFGLTEAPIRRGGAQPKKQMPYVVTQSVAETIDRLVLESGAHNRGELFTAVLRSYLGVE